ncbi:unnamed protein product, partial [Meganyctiphanes norvegica]
MLSSEGVGLMSESESRPESPVTVDRMDISRHRFPVCIVWTPLPLITWFLPFIGHMGISMCSGVIRDFAGPYFVSEDNMAFGWPTKYWQLDAYRAQGGPNSWDRSVILASEEYSGRMGSNYCCNSPCRKLINLNILSQNHNEAFSVIILCILLPMSKKIFGDRFWGFIKWINPDSLIGTLKVIILLTY